MGLGGAYVGHGHVYRPGAEGGREPAEGADEREGPSTAQEEGSSRSGCRQTHSCREGGGLADGEVKYLSFDYWSFLRKEGESYSVKCELRDFGGD